MGFYLELYCDTPDCPYGANQEGPQGTSRARIGAEAKRNGWRLIEGQWHCPGCVHDVLYPPGSAKRCETNITLADGSCAACGAYNGQRCQSG